MMTTSLSIRFSACVNTVDADAGDHGYQDSQDDGDDDLEEHHADHMTPNI